MDQELLTLQNHQSSSRFLVGIHVAQSSVFSIVVYTSWWCTRLAAASDKVYQLLAHSRWFSPVSSRTKTGRHDIAESDVKHQKSNQSNLYKKYKYFVWDQHCVSFSNGLRQGTLVLI